MNILKINKKRYKKIKSQFRFKLNAKININPKKILYSFLALVIFIICLAFVILIYQNKKLANIISNNNFLLNLNNSQLPINYFDYNNKENDQENDKKNLIHVSYSLDEQLIYPTLISMLSGLDNCNKDNMIIYHLLLSHNFNITKFIIFESLKEKYEVKIYYYIIPNIFGSLGKWTEGTDCVYYKILLPFIFPDYERMIYLDGDTLIRKDIFEMYNYPFNDNYILGYPFYTGYVMKKHGIEKPSHYINGGCLLFNIKKMREDHKDIDLLSLTIKNNSKWGFREQDSINYLFVNNSGFLPLKYGIYMIGSKSVFNALSKYTYSPLNLTEGYKAIEDPSVVHFSCCWPKVWTNGTKNLFKNNEICLRYQKEFYNYAKKSKYYQIINDTFFYRPMKKKRSRVL